MCYLDSPLAIKTEIKRMPTLKNFTVNEFRERTTIKDGTAIVQTSNGTYELTGVLPQDVREVLTGGSLARRCWTYIKDRGTLKPMNEENVGTIA